ncbi:MAG TPA: hypothetical protein VFK02_06670 [Kofleriaceae bacterium]|nr:hypothetical protein [Kofleriaceae bacterium]
MTCRERIALAAAVGALALLGAGRAWADDAPGGPPPGPATGTTAGTTTGTTAGTTTGPATPTTPLATAGAIDHRLAERLVRLAEHHYRNGEYYRAISAYEELALFADDDSVRRYAAVRIAMSYHRGHQLDDAIAGYRAALALARGGDLAQALRIQLAVARAERSLEAPDEPLDAVAAELAPSTTGGRLRPLALAQLARITGLAGDRAAARKLTSELHAACGLPGAERIAASTATDGAAPSAPTDAALAPTRAALPPDAAGCSLAPALVRALEAPVPARRSPALGVALSLVVPGAGSVYGGRLVDGLYYFALTTLSGLGALDVHDGDRAWTDQKATFYGLAALAAIFYAGSAVQGYVSVARHNAVAEHDARRALWRTTDAPLPLEDLAPAR